EGIAAVAKHEGLQRRQDLALEEVLVAGEDVDGLDLRARGAFEEGETVHGGIVREPKPFFALGKTAQNGCCPASCKEDCPRQPLDATASMRQDVVFVAKP